MKWSSIVFYREGHGKIMGYDITIKLDLMYII